MAEMSTFNSTSTPCSPPTRGKTTTSSSSRMEDTDPFKPFGTLTFRIDNFREFTKRPPWKVNTRHCDATVSVRGLTFGLAVCPVRCVPMKDPTQEFMCMRVIVKCENTNGGDVNGDRSWSCLASMTLRFKNLLRLRTDGIHKFTHRFFSSKDGSSLEWPLRFRFDHLVDPKNGLYDEEEDTLELVAEITVDAPVGVMKLPRTDAIQVNEQTVFINKNQLAMHSDYFHSMFYNEKFDEGKSGVYEVKIEAPATVEHFKWMLDTMSPVNRPLDDRCIEGVLHLANRFLVTDVEGKCLEFLTEKSKKPALFKYRMADKYGCTALKDHVLLNLKTTDFKDKMFMANMAECDQLGSNAAKALKTRFDELFPPEPDEDEEWSAVS